MNANAEKWVAALRSGEFKQGDGALRHKDTFCCLGVACELFRRETKTGRWEEEYGQEYFVAAPDDGADDVLPRRVRDWLGIAQTDGGYKRNTLSLADLNDNGSPFDQIADVIESEPEGLFAHSPTEGGGDDA